jgi:hypothetical protein
MMPLLKIGDALVRLIVTVHPSHRSVCCSLYTHGLANCHYSLITSKIIYRTKQGQEKLGSVLSIEELIGLVWLAG